MKLIIDIPVEAYKTIINTFFHWNVGLTFKQSAKDIEKTKAIFNLVDALDNGTPIPDNATNGDVIKAIFPNIQISDSEVMKNVYTGIPYGEFIGANIVCMRDWWNAPYQKGGKVE